MSYKVLLFTFPLNKWKSQYQQEQNYDLKREDHIANGVKWDCHATEDGIAIFKGLFNVRFASFFFRLTHFIVFQV